MIRRPPKSTRTATLGPHTALVRSGEHRILGETPAAFEYVQHVSNLRSHGLRAEDRASWLAAICPEMGISATEDVGETDRSIEQGANQQSCRSEEHTSELQSLLPTSYAVFCLKQKQNRTTRSN